MRVVTFKVEEDLLEKLNSLARLKNTTRSDIIRKAIELYLRLEDDSVRPRPRYVRLMS